MIADDMITFVRNDLVVFGIGVAVFLVIVLSLIFREARWVVLPLAGCFYAGLLMIGMLGLAGWKVTVISSNFLALMLIITISMNIHLTVRYRQLHRDFPELSHHDLVATTVRRMVWPCLYTALTTIIGFGSLVFSGIKPVIDFGWMMSIGLAVTFVTAFTLFPAIVLLLGRTPRHVHSGAGGVPERPAEEYRFTRRGHSSTGARRRTARRAGWSASPGVLLVVCALGVSSASPSRTASSTTSATTPRSTGVSRSSTASSAAPHRWRSSSISTRTASSTTSRLRNPPSTTRKPSARRPGYWFTEFKIERIKEVHDWLASQPEVGKVLSLASLIRVGETLNNGEPLDSLQLALVWRPRAGGPEAKPHRPLHRHPVGRGADLAPHPRHPARPAPQGAARPDPRGPRRRAGARPGRRHRERTARALQQHAPEPLHVADLDPRRGARRPSR